VSIFSDSERQRIADAITAVEERTAGEIVVAEVPRSDSYTDVRLVVAIVLGLGTASAVHLVWPTLALGAVLGAQLIAGIAGYGLSGIQALLRRLVPRRLSERAVGREAELSFLEHGVFRTRDRTGVLIFLSDLEHRVVILGDEGIHQRLQNPGWSELVGSLVLAVKSGRAGDGVCSVVQKLGETLARDAPIRDGDSNELPNEVRTRR
jgi:putative membrane protein